MGPWSESSGDSSSGWCMWEKAVKPSARNGSLRPSIFHLLQLTRVLSLPISFSPICLPLSSPLCWGLNSRSTEPCPGPDFSFHSDIRSVKFASLVPAAAMKFNKDVEGSCYPLLGFSSFQLPRCSVKVSRRFWKETVCEVDSVCFS